jgi:SM-20-related protein
MKSRSSEGAFDNSLAFNPEQMADAIAANGWYVCDGFISANAFTDLRQELNQLWETESFRRAGIGKLTDYQKDASIRGDYIHWIDQINCSASMTIYLDQLREVQAYINRSLFLGLKDLELHYAIYPEGSFYKRHRDRFKQQAHRIISVVLYLNKEWQPSHGGELCLYTGTEERVKIEPVGGRLVFF